MIGVGVGIWSPAVIGRRPASPFTPARVAPYRIAVYGDSFGQRATDILGTPNSLDSGTVNPVTFRWPSEDTFRVGGVAWGTSAWLAALSGGRYRVPYQINRAVGGSNSGQCNQDGGSTTDRLSVIKTLIAAEVAAGRPVHGVVLHLGTNDTVTDFTVAQSYGNIKNICQQMIAAGAGCIVMHTILPQGNSAVPSARIDGTTGSRTDPNPATNPAGVTGPGDTRQRTLDLNAALVATLATETGLVGKVIVVDPFSAFSDPGGQAGDVLPALVYDGLHLSAEGCHKLANDWLIPAFNTLLPATVEIGLPTDATGPLGTAGNFEGTGGTLAGGFTGPLADGWSIGSLTQFSNVNVSGTKACSKETGKQVVTIAASSAGSTDNRTVQFNITIPVTLPGDVAIGDYYEAGIMIEAAGMTAFRSCDLELRITEPDATVRTVRVCQPPPSNTSQNDAHTLVSRDETYVFWTPPRIRKAGAYGTITLAAVAGFAGSRASIAGTLKFSRATIRKAAFAG